MKRDGRCCEAKGVGGVQGGASGLSWDCALAADKVEDTVMLSLVVVEG